MYSLPLFLIQETLARVTCSDTDLAPKIQDHIVFKISSNISTSSRTCTNLQIEFEVVISLQPNDYVSSSAAKLSQNAHRLI